MGFGYSGGQVEWKRNRAQAISSLLRVRTCSLPSAVCNYTHEEVLGLHISFQILVLLSENGPVLSCEVQKVRFAMAMTLVLIANMLKCLVDLPHISTLPCCHCPLKHCPLPRVEHLLHASLSLSHQHWTVRVRFVLDRAWVKYNTMKDALVEYDSVTRTSGYNFRWKGFMFNVLLKF